MSNSRENYIAKYVESASPISKMPSTPFRLGVLGILEEDNCKVLPNTLSDIRQSRPYPYPIVANVIATVCQLEIVDIDNSNIRVGRTTTILLDHGTNKDYVSHVTTDEPDIVAVSITGEELHMSFLQEYEGVVNVTVHYGNCLSCDLGFKLTVPEEEEVEPPTEPTDPPTEPVTEKCKGVHTGESSSIKIGNSRNYRPTDAQKEIMVGLDIEVSSTGIVSLEETGAPEFEVRVTGESVGEVYVKFITYFNDGTTCQRISKISIYDTYQNPTPVEAPEGFEEEDDGVEGFINNIDREGREPVIPAQDIKEMLQKLHAEDIYMILCAGNVLEGSNYSVSIGGKLLASNIEVEGGHKAVILNLPDRPSIEKDGREVTITIHSTTKNKWSVYIADQPHAVETDNSGYNTITLGNIHNYDIEFESEGSTATNITKETGTNVITLQIP